jgi:hypothetical protein
MTAVILLADARLVASSITRSSMRCSFVGEQVDWTIKMSLPRMLSWISTDVSPSEKRLTSPRPRPTPKILQMLSVSGLLEFPANTQMLEFIVSSLLYRMSLTFKEWKQRIEGMAHTLSMRGHLCPPGVSWLPGCKKQTTSH